MTCAHWISPQSGAKLEALVDVICFIYFRVFKFLIISDFYEV